jgi:hypothetical protein
MAVEPLESFFREYGIASLSDPLMLVARYAERFVVAGPRGSAVFTNDATFVDWLQHLQQFNQRIGMTSLTVVGITKTRPLSDRHLLPTVEWGATFTKTGERVVTFRISYRTRIPGRYSHTYRKRTRTTRCGH